MVYKIKLKPKAEKELNKIPLPYYDWIVKRIGSLASNPFIGKKLAGEFKGYYSIRVWPYRIIYVIFKKWLIIYIVSISHRQGVYKN
ncbi:type II toxin-antitoxin system mRNA interferase toxin, RelE/StbE family [Candidatus Roizmanbacteria bacterium CG02_land_8_20_14_3_00_36_15]|uniref:Type II toxin-antitoxin system mRNA interferase toxin, RelE/StbE family n=1 Tax=Candidatus Roizmanbacteria bacterium CG10_big_fil_rev_8_21_14_0_10_36_26 TaxID=1974851 RepID=A0A2M8KL81_9BACT|nr:MAG: type II toxin-antitoxin system mRNA interferase toxin, RelE/StbE family [Candidatus Roizmanbacteria bacterium CG02_land_8_20_14_3_00_36_15]PIY69832.1 MAG: type II toxin-antitoxin system mRNA interferase toxin, RelE/StbE family [Candidatus Roizmanbacteria bacterium CG_4_10_14_0_8_um_filter_36_36]PJA53225.1 MAG: type II toxin-antitoxin system mRNA interferase toxin, RelE/StbE family [Candidatus Roizmanbacteria bacterium CG_4_9_14_3_um_filter_36_11]PJE60672.1 MAG: type II toxin-antitoxin sy